MRIIVTGDADEEMVYAALDILHAITPVTMVIECGGPSAELWARFWAEDNDVELETVREDTPVRTANEAFALRPKYVLAFPWPAMTIIDKAKRKGVQIGYASISVPKALDTGGATEALGQSASSDAEFGADAWSLDGCGPEPESEAEGWPPLDPAEVHRSPEFAGAALD